MPATTADLNPKTLEGARRQFVELYGSALVTNTYLRIALALVSLVALGLVFLHVHTASRYWQLKPLVIRLDELAKPPSKASVSFQKRLYSPGTRQERAPQTFIAQIDFGLRDRVPNEFVRVNPLGLQISYFRVDQAF